VTSCQEKAYRDQYLEKMELVNGLEPYKKPKKELAGDTDLLLNTPYVFSYFVCGVRVYAAN